MAAPLRLTLLGGFEARLGRAPELALPRKSQALLTYLALARHPTCAREELAALLWGDTPDVQARQSLRKALLGLRRAINRDGVSALVVSNLTVALDRSAVAVDVWQFDELVRRRTPEALARAVALYRGDILAGITVDEEPFSDWLAVERRRRWEAARQAFVGLLDHRTRNGAGPAAIETAMRLLVLDPLHEPGRRALMRLYVAEGQPSAALREYQTCVDLLQRELGVEPAPETRRLYESILRDQSRDTLSARPARVVERRVPASPLIGRTDEAARLSAAITAAAGGQAGVVVIRGDAGIGKTRLLDHACAEATARAGRVCVGRAYPSEQILPFGPWMDAFRTGGIVDEPALQRPDRQMWRVELARLLPELGTAPPGDDPVRLFEAVATLLTDLAERAPLLLALEDLHWADDLSVRLLAFLSRRLRGHRVLFVVTVREDGLADAPTLGTLLRDLDHDGRLVSIELRPLSGGDIVTLVDALARRTGPAAVAGLAERIARMSEGNPLMAVETLRALEQGARSAENGDLPIAARVRDVILGRLERVSAPARALLDTAAVVGRDFGFALLQRASGLNEAEAAAGVEQLVRRRLFGLAGDGFHFTHDRVREVLDGEMLPPRRRLLHRRVAEALEALHAADPASVSNALAFHYRQAEIWDRALPWSRVAGGRAFILGGLREAAAAFTQALDALAHLPETAETLAQAVDVRLDLRHSLQPLAEVETVVPLMKETLALAERLGDRKRLGHVLAFLSTHHWWDGEHTQAIDRARRSLALADELDDARMRVSALYCEAQARQAIGEYAMTAELLRSCLAPTAGGLTSQRFGSTDFTRVFSTSRLAATLAELGDFADAQVVADEAVRTSERLRHPYLLSFGYRAAAWVAVRHGRFDEAVAWLERLHNMQTAEQFEISFPVARWMLAYAYALARRPEAEPLLDRLLSPPPPPRLRIFTYALWLGCLAEACLHTGRRAEAHHLARAAVNVGRAHGEHGHTGWALRVLGDVALANDDRAEAEERYREALTIARARGMRPLEAHCLAGRGDIAAARAMYRDMGMAPWLDGDHRRAQDGHVR